MLKRLLLPELAKADDLAWLILRLGTAAFLIPGVWDNISSAARMEEFVGFLTQFGFPAPRLMAPLSVWAQFLCGLLIAAGLLTRLAGLVLAFNFLVAIGMVHWAQDIRGWWPALALVLIGIALAGRGAGRYSVDAVFGGR